MDLGPPVEVTDEGDRLASGVPRLQEQEIGDRRWSDQRDELGSSVVTVQHHDPIGMVEAHDARSGKGEGHACAGCGELKVVAGDRQGQLGRPVRQPPDQAGSPDGEHRQQGGNDHQHHREADHTAMMMAARSVKPRRYEEFAQCRPGFS